MRRTIFSKRTLALLLATLMTLSVVYVPAFATGSEVPAEHVCDFSGELHVVAPDHVNGKSGYSYYECQVEGCDKVHILDTSLVDPDQGDHVWDDHAAVAPTCTTPGNVAYKTCKAADCDVVADENGNVVEGGVEAFVIPALGHKFTEWTVTTDFLCTDLHTSRECLACGFVESVEWDEDTHDYQPVFDETYVAPLCNKDGKVTFKCVSEHASGIECSAVIENVKITRTRQHITEVVEYVAPTCTEEGMQEYYVCTMCNGNFSVPNSQGNVGAISSLNNIKIDATGHDMSDFTRVEGMGCGVENNMISTCKNGCGHEVFATETHSWSDPERLPNLGCGIENNMKSECALCGEVVYSTQNHKYSEVSKTETVAYCEKTVVLVEACEYCGDTTTTTTTEEFHANVNTLAAVKVTCVADGLTEGKQCADCGKVLVAQETISSAELHAAHEAAGNHKPAQAYVFPTCTQVGFTSGTKCTECEIVIVAPEEIPATGHTYNTKEIAPTCQTVGYRVGGICQNEYCGYVVPGKTIPVVDCAPKANKTLVSAATCNSYAVYTSDCKWCGSVIDNIIDEAAGYDADNHNGAAAIDVANSVAADCVTDGYAYYVCANCDFEIKIIPNTADKADHEADGLVVMTEDEFKAEYPGVLTFTVTKTGHRFDHIAIDKAPTCTENGLKVWYCQNSGCNEKKEETPAATGHSNDGEGVYTVVTPATCYATGLAKYICATCNAQIGADIVLDKTAHTPGTAVTENTVAPKCEVDGSHDEVVYCTVEDCGAEISRKTVTDKATGHGEFNVFVSTTAGCTTAGVETYACANGCGKTTTVEVAPYGHKEGEKAHENEVAAGCTTYGSYDEVIRCTECDKILHSKAVVVDPTGHHGAEAVVEDKVLPTCVDDGTHYSVVYCKDCHVELSREKIITKATGHTPKTVYENVVDADCLVGGSYDEVVYCTVCDKELSRTETYVEALGHTPSDVVEELGADSTCTTPGYYFNVTYCSVCGVEIDRTEQPIEPKGHTPGAVVVENNIAPDCLNGGSYDEVVYCTVDGCGAELSRETITVDPKGHTYNGYKSVVTLGTCDNGAGVYVKNCSVCDLETEADDSETVPFDTTVCDHGTQALVDGKIVYVSAYGDNKNQTIDGEWTYVAHVHNNCQTGTVGGYICGTCGDEEVIDSHYADKKVGSEIEASHDYETIVHDATCTVEGYIEMKCTECGHSYTIDDSYYVADMNDKTVHTINGYSVIKVLASCENPEGIYVEVCEDCGKSFETKVTFNGAKGHGYVAIVNGELVTVDAYTNKNTSTSDWTYIAHVSNKCQEGTVGGWVCGICDYTEYENAAYEGKLIGSKIKPVHNMTADAKTPSCEGIGEVGYTYHEYCLDCDLGNDPVRDGWTVLPCTPCVVVTVSANAPTCHVAGNNEYSYSACCATKAEIDALAAANVIPATNHVGTIAQIQTAPATCTTPSFIYEVCTACNGEETFKLISYIAPLGHNVVALGNGVDATCTVDGKESDKDCSRCHAADTFVAGATIPATGHTNANGDKFLDTDRCSVEGLADDRFCVTCQADIDFTHRYDVQIFNATCQTGEIHINTCVDCNTQKAMEVVRGPWTEEEHREEILNTVPVVTPATPTEYGKEVYTCPHCGETITINKPLAGGIEFALDYNVVYPVFDEAGNIVSFTASDRKETANGTWIAVDVLVYSNSEFAFSQIDLSIKYNSGVQFYGDFANYTTDIDNFVVESVKKDKHTVKVSAGIDPNAEAPFTSINTVGEDAEGAVLTTLYFMVSPYAANHEVSIGFAATPNVYLADEEDNFTDITMFAEVNDEPVEFTSAVLADYYVDGVINGVELLMIKQMINGNLEETYDVTLDLNKDGEVTVVDYEILKALVNFSNTLDNETYASVASMGCPIEEC